MLAVALGYALRVLDQLEGIRQWAPESSSNFIHPPAFGWDREGGGTLNPPTGGRCGLWSLNVAVYKAGLEE